MFCTRCGTQLDETARFCTKCGAPTTQIVIAPAFETKRLRRIMQGKKIAGVCTGYAEYFNMDVTLMRLIWVGLLLVPPNIGLIAYIVSWIVLPKE
jgi:phage shock protein C